MLGLRLLRALLASLASLAAPSIAGTWTLTWRAGWRTVASQHCWMPCWDGTGEITDTVGTSTFSGQSDDVFTWRTESSSGSCAAYSLDDNILRDQDGVQRGTGVCSNYNMRGRPQAPLFSLSLVSAPPTQAPPSPAFLALPRLRPHVHTSALRRAPRRAGLP